VRKAFIAGLLHNIHRPALGEAGQGEHEEKGSRIAKEIISKSEFHKSANEISNSLIYKDERILNRRSNLLTEILSIADKIQMSFQMRISYTWASNRKLQRNKKNSDLSLFYRNLQRFYTLPGKSMESFQYSKNQRCEQSYILVYQDK